jgi:signal transduction histidine kinase
VNVTESHEYRWALPSVLLGDGGDGRPVRRSTRDWFVDIVMFLLACGLSLLTFPELADEPEPVIALEQVAGVLACLSVWLRRRWPVGFAVVTSVLSTYLELVGGAAVVGLFTVAVHRPFKVSGSVALLSLITLLPFVFLRPDPELGPLGTFVLGLAIMLTVFAWGVVVRARRQLVWTLRQRADIAAEQAKRLERERIAREMHDVLAHRLSMLSLHAGALEFRPDAPAEEIARAAGAIRSSAHLALQDLREVIGVLRHPDAPGDEPVPDRPQPTLADLPALVAECEQAGMDVRLDLGVRDAPESLGRTLYRIVQEALTNARKHADGAAATVAVAGAPGEGLSAEVRNALWPRSGPRIPGAGAGLIGLTERAQLAGGRLEHGATPEGDFLVRAWLPWPADHPREDA